MSDFMDSRVSFVVREEASAGKGVEVNHYPVVRATGTLYAIGEWGPAQYSILAVLDERKKKVQQGLSEDGYF